MKKFCILISLLLLTAVYSFAAPNLINYQGVLTDNLGAPVTNATQAMTFRLFDAATAGTLLWEEIRTINVQNGSYNLLLGSVTPLDPAILAVNNVWLEIEVSGEVLSGRQQLASVPYALQAASADVALTVPDGAITSAKLATDAVHFSDGDFINCYSGSQPTRGVGVCVSGSKIWQGGAFSLCQGEIVPTPEICTDGIDSDCDGLIDCSDSDCATDPACYTCGNGVCGTSEGWETCAADCGPVGLVINEVDYDQPGTDTAEFIEIFNASASTINLTGYVVELINGADGSVYASFTLTDAKASLLPGEYLVLGSVSVLAVNHLVIPDNIIQNGSPDGIHLSIPGNANAGTDSLVYEGGIAGYGEGSALTIGDAGAADDSLARCPNGLDTDDNNSDFILVNTTTPGSANICQ